MLVSCIVVQTFYYDIISEALYLYLLTTHTSMICLFVLAQLIT